MPQQLLICYWILLYWLPPLLCAEKCMASLFIKSDIITLAICGAKKQLLNSHSCAKIRCSNIQQK